MHSQLSVIPFNCITDYAIESLQSVNLEQIRTYFDIPPAQRGLRDVFVFTCPGLTPPQSS